MAKRLLFDISTSMRWIGPPVGIVRVERELARWAIQNAPHCEFVFFDPNLQSYRAVPRSHVPDILDGITTVDTTGMMDPSRLRRRRADYFPRFLVTPYLWLTQTRRMALRTLGGMLFLSHSRRMRWVIHRLQPMVAGKKYRSRVMRPDGSQRALVPVHLLASAPLPLQSGDWVLMAGANWAHSNAAILVDGKKRIGVGLIVLCHDVIPLLFPQYLPASDVALLQRHFDQVFAIAALNLVASQVVRRDLETYCATRGIAVGPVRQIPFGSDLPPDGHRSAGRDASRPPSRYILLVSTIEPRKGHRLVHTAWSRLLQEGIPQALDVTLLLVGRRGWMVDDLIALLRSCERIAVMDHVDDQTLAALYDGADFCIFPSEYEGYGLPVVEALRRGTPVLASEVGVVPELQSPLLKRLPARDAQAWYLAIREWLVNASSLPGCSDAAAEFHHPTWQQAAAETFAAIEAFTARAEPI